jgi:hypothetical protein
MVSSDAKFHVDWASEPPWYASQSAQVVRAVQLFNSQPPSMQAFVASGGWQGYDVVRLYTNIDIADLNEKLSAVLASVWQQHAAAARSAVAPANMVVEVFKDKCQPAVWRNSLAAFHQQYPLVAARASGTHYRLNERLGRDAQR